MIRGVLKIVFLVSVFAALFIAPLAAGTDVLFSPEDNVQERLIELIKNSTQEIDIMIYSFTQTRTASALVDAKKRGVNVRVIADKSQIEKYGDSVVPSLAGKGINVKLMSGRKARGKAYIMHNKAAIFDGKIVMTGSYNWTYSANKHNYENAVFIDDPAAVGKYKLEFERLWNK